MQIPTEDNIRLNFWHSAISEALQNVRTAKKITLCYQEMLRKQIDHTRLENIDSWQPDFNELLTAEISCHKMAIIAFCQIKKSGGATEEILAQNNRKFYDKYFCRILDHSHPPFNEEEIDKLYILIEDVEWARDKTIAHIDGKAYSIEVYPNNMSRIDSVLFKDIDWEFFENALERLSWGIGFYQIKATNDLLPPVE